MGQVVRARDQRRRERLRRHAGGHRDLERVFHRGHEGVVDPVEVTLELDELDELAIDAGKSFAASSVLGCRQPARLQIELVAGPHRLPELGLVDHRQ